MNAVLFALGIQLLGLPSAGAESPAQPFDGAEEIAILALVEAEPAQLLASVRDLGRHYRGDNNSALFALLTELVKRSQSTVRDEDLLKEPLGATFEHQAIHALVDVLYQWPNDVLIDEVTGRLIPNGGHRTVATLLAARAVSAHQKVMDSLLRIAVKGNVTEQVLTLLAMGESADTRALTFVGSHLNSDQPAVRQAALVSRHRIRLSLGQVEFGTPSKSGDLGGIVAIGRGSNIGGGYSIPKREIQDKDVSLIVMEMPHAGRLLESPEFSSHLKEHLSSGATLLLINSAGADWPQQVLQWANEMGIALPREVQATAGMGVPVFDGYQSFCDFPYELREQAGDAAAFSWKVWGKGQAPAIRSARTGGALFVVQENVQGKGRVVSTTVSLRDHDVYRENFLRWVFGDALLQHLAGYKAPLFQMDPSGKTPHVPWYKPGAGKPVSLVWAAGKTFKRTLPEMVQRMDLDWSFVPYTAFFDRPVRTKETLAVPTLMGQRAMEIFEQELFKKEVFVLTYGEVDLGSLVHSRPARASMNSLPARVRRKLLQRVRQGAGLVVLGQNGAQFSIERAREDWASFGEEDQTLLEQARRVLPFDADETGESVISRKVGKGRAVWFCRNLPSDFILQEMPHERTPPDSFSVPALDGHEFRIRASEYDYALLVKTILWAAGRTSASNIDLLTDAVSPAGKPWRVAVGLPGRTDARLSFRLRNAYDEIVQEKEIDCSAGKAEAEIPAVSRGGYVAEYRLRDANGNVIDFAAQAVSVDSEFKIDSIETDRLFYKNGDDVKLTVVVKALASVVHDDQPTLAISAVDSYGRELFTQRVPIGPKSTDFNLTVPVRNPLSRLLELRVSLESGGLVLDHQRKPVGLDLGVAELDFDVETNVPDSLAEMFKTQFGVDTAITTATTGMRHNFNFGLGSWAHPIGPLITSSSRTDPKVRVPCLSDPATRLQTLLDARALHKTYGSLGVRHYMVADECTHGMCESEHCLFRFRRKMRQEYGSVERLNKEWRTTFNSWQRVTPFTKDGFTPDALGRWIDYRWFNEWVFAEYCNFIEMACEDTMPGLKAGHSGRSGRSLLMSLSRLFYYYGVSERDVSIARPGSVIGSWYAPGYRFVENHETQCRRWPWWHLLRGTNKMCLWYSKLGTPAIHGDLSRPYMAFVWLKEEMDDLNRGMGKLLLHCKRGEGQAAEYTSLRSDMVKSKLKEFDLAPLKRSDFAGVCLPLQHECRYVSELMVEKGALEARQIKLLFLPAIVSLSTEERASIRNFVKRGGVVVADYNVATRNEHGTKVGDEFTSEIFGCRVTESKEQSAEPGNGLPVSVATDSPVPLRRISTADDLKVEIWGEQLKLIGGKAALTIGEGIPAAVVNRCGEGVGIYLNFNLNSLTCKTDNASSLFMEDLLALAQIRPSINVRTSDQILPVDFGVFRDADAFYTGFVQQGKGGMLADETATECDIRFEKKAHLYDSRTGQYLGLMDAYSASLTPSVAQLYASLPYRLEQIKVDGPDSIRRGSSAKFEVSLLTGGVGAVQHVLLVNVIDPTGKPAPAHTKKMLVLNGQCSLEIPVALNAPVGEWQVQLRDAATGVTQTREFSVQ